jgi:branched-chain amino acid transport system permease protein
MLQYIIAGLVLGGIYAISSAALIITYVSTGVMNFAFGSIAFFIARLYYYLYVENGWPLPLAAFVSIAIVGPVFMILLYWALLRYLPHRRQLIRVVAMIGIAVALPAVATIIFGHDFIQSAPGLSPQPPHVYHIFGAAVTTDQLISLICVGLILVLGTYVVRRTSVGLVVRAVVDSPAMTSLSGTNPSKVAVAVWAVNGLLAGLAGVLSAPILNVSDVDNYTLLLAAAFAAVVAAQLRNVALGVLAGLLMGIATAIAQWLLPADSFWSVGVVESIPFAFIVISLVVYAIRDGGGTDRTARLGGALDAALRSSHAQTVRRRDPESAGRRGSSVHRPRIVATTLHWLAQPLSSPGVVVAVLLPLVLSGYRVGLAAQAAAYGIVFLSYTLLTGQGGVISLCQITFAGIGAIGTAQLASINHWPLGLAIVASGLIAGAIGITIGALTLRMGELYIALATLAFGLLMYQLVFSLGRFQNEGLGVPINRPSFAVSDIALCYLTLAVFLVLGLTVVLVQRSTIGLALAASRSSQDGARALGVGVISIRLFIFGLSAFVASVGGSMLAVYAGSALPDSYQALVGLVWLAVLVTFGARTSNAAMFAGLAFVFTANLVSVYLPLSWAPIPIIAFGLGAILVAKDPEGTVATVNRQIGHVGHLLGDLISGRRTNAAFPTATTESGG